jgi:hypothetical protein
LAVTVAKCLTAIKPRLQKVQPKASTPIHRLKESLIEKFDGRPYSVLPNGSFLVGQVALSLSGNGLTSPPSQALPSTYLCTYNNPSLPTCDVSAQHVSVSISQPPSFSRCDLPI